jgi:large subunit ribosomal protein L3
MGRKQGPRKGSLQFWPRKRASKAIPSVNWKPLVAKADKAGLAGFIGYKVGMMSAFVKDSTPDSMTKNKKISIPVTILEVPTMKIFSTRFYKNGKVMADVINDNVDKEMKKVVKLPKQPKAKTQIETIEKQGKFDDIRVIVYSQVKKTGIKKTPNISEIALGGSKEEKLAFVKEKLDKEISISDVFDKEQKIVDVRGVTTGRGTQGPVKRFGIQLRIRKTEKGIRHVGSIGPWHPARITFRVPMAGQTGLFNRIIYNNSIIDINKISEKDINLAQGFKRYGKIKTDYIILRGCVQGPSKRQVLLTTPLRATKKQLKKNYELVELR